MIKEQEIKNYKCSKCNSDTIILHLKERYEKKYSNEQIYSLLKKIQLSNIYKKNKSNAEYKDFSNKIKVIYICELLCTKCNNIDKKEYLKERY